MKKIIIMFFLLFIMTGCTVVRIDTTDIDNTINIMLSKENKLYNCIGKGYKYYVPRGVTYIDTDELNDKLYSNGDYYYLYIDAISYYYQKNIDYLENTTSYYSKKIDINGKSGYLQIDKYNDKYLIQFVYNYAKIETIVDLDKINEAVLNSTYILSTIKFNHDVVKLMLNDDYLTNKEEVYDLFVPKKVINSYVGHSDDNNSVLVDDSGELEGTMDDEYIENSNINEEVE